VKWQLVIFDCDGVLVDSEPISNRIFSQMLRESGLAMSLEACYEHLMGRSMDDCVRILDEHFGHAIDAQFVARLRRRTLEALREEVQPVPGVAAAIEQIPMPKCVASSGQLEKMRATLEKTGLLHHFEGRLFSAAGMPRGKPHPDIFLHAASAMAAEPASCVVIEDTSVGVEAAVAAGMSVYAYAGLSSAQRLSAAGARVFTDMQRLPDLLERGP